jgi:hypothetical protein
MRAAPRQVPLSSSRGRGEASGGKNDELRACTEKERFGALLVGFAKGKKEPPRRSGKIGGLGYRVMANLPHPSRSQRFSIFRGKRLGSPITTITQARFPIYVCAKMAFFGLASSL